MRDLDALFTGVLLATGPRPPMTIMTERVDWMRAVERMLGETVSHHVVATKELFVAYSRWLETRENHANLQRL